MTSSRWRTLFLVSHCVLTMLLPWLCPDLLAGFVVALGMACLPWAFMPSAIARRSTSRDMFGELLSKSPNSSSG